MFWWDSFTVWLVDPYRATWLWTNQMSACVCVCVLDTHPIVWGALWGAEVTGWGTWVRRVSFPLGTHGICRCAICCVFNAVWSSVSQHKGRALGPAHLSSVQLEKLESSSRKKTWWMKLTKSRWHQTWCKHEYVEVKKDKTGADVTRWQYKLDDQPGLHGGGGILTLD